MMKPIEVDLASARFWARMNKGNVRGVIWSRAVTRFENLLEEGRTPVIWWWDSKDKQDPVLGGGLVEVTDAPVLRGRRRRRRVRV